MTLEGGNTQGGVAKNKSDMGLNFLLRPMYVGLANCYGNIFLYIVILILAFATCDLAITIC
jgi:hypothetical protein